MAASYYLARSIAHPEYRAHMAERFGAIPEGLAGRVAALPRRPVWIQAVSVGEVMVARTLIEGLRRSEAASPPFLVSSTTPSGRRMAVESLGGTAVGVFHFPLDWRPIVRRTLRAIGPAAFVSIETELWPGLLTECARASLPVVVANGRISVRSRERYARLGRVMQEPLQAIRLACMQTPDDAERLVSLGVPADRVVVTGNMKFDAVAGGSAQDAHDLFGLSLDRRGPVLVAGSTSPGEEEQVLEAVRLAGVPDLGLVIAPRHRERFEDVAALMTSRGLAFSRRSRPAPAGAPPKILLLDTLGELNAAYGLATVAFVGGSLVPRGGQNLIEPAARGVPVLFGPHTENFSAVARSLIDAGAGFRVQDAAGLAAALRALCADEGARRRAGAAGRALIEEHRGATDRTIDHVLPLLR